jgi:hypothetical protein
MMWWPFPRHGCRASGVGVTSVVDRLAGADPAAVDFAGQRLRVVMATVRAAASRVRAALPPGWTGAGSSAARLAVAHTGARLDTAAGLLEMLCLALAAVAGAVRSYESEVAAARRVLLAVTSAPSGGAAASAAVWEELDAAWSRFRVADERGAALIMGALATPLVRLPGPSGVPAIAAGTPPVASRHDLASEVAEIAPRPAAPAAVAMWWAGLSDESRRDLASGWPLLIGGVDGVPGRVRDAANRRALASAIREAVRDRERERAADSVRDLSRELTGLLPWPLSTLAHAALGPSAASRRLAALQAIDASLRRPGSELLVFDGSGDGQAVVSTGDVEHASAVAVMVPGMNTELEDVPRMQGNALRLADAAGAGVVVVAWLGYDAPNVLQVASDSRARSGAGELRRFTAGLRATEQAPQRLTLVGHSYGSLVAGIAGRQDSAADDLVLLASPGVEAERATDLEIPAGHVWAARVLTDPIQLVYWPAIVGDALGLPAPTVFGPDPAADAFGAQHFGTAGALGHSGYFSSGSQSLRNVGAIVAGRPVIP